MSAWARSAAVSTAAARIVIVALLCAAPGAHAQPASRDTTRRDTTTVIVFRANLPVDSTGALGTRDSTAHGLPRTTSTSLGVSRTAQTFDASHSLDGLPIHEILFEPHDIFDPVPHGHLAGFYRAANRLHMRTRHRTLREQMLFAPGEPWLGAAGDETMRHLRALDFLTPDSIVARRVGDSVSVRVVTHDTWTTSPEFNLENSGGQGSGSVAFTERNFLGYGKSLSFAYRNEPAGISRSGSITDPALGGSRLKLQLEAGTGTAGATNSLWVGVPFYAEATPYAYNVAWSRSTSVTRLYSNGEVAADFDERNEQAELSWGRGVRNDGTITRWIGSFLVRDRRLGPTRLQPGAPPDFDGGEDNLKIRRLAGELRLWHPHYVQKSGIDRMTGVEDYDLGPAASIKLGLSPHFLGGTADEGYSRFELHAATETPLGFGMLGGSIESRLRWTPVEIVRKLDARWVTQGPHSNTLVLAAHGVGGERVPRDFQVATGGLSGLRAYPVHALSGRRLWRFNAEDRWIVGREYWHLITIGGAAFYDGARAWGPGAGGSEWHHDIGAGLRLALPHSSLNQVVRFDVAFPVSPTRDGERAPVFSVGSSQAF